MDAADDTLDPGAWLVKHRQLIDQAEATWLQRLAAFDAAGEWAADGQLSCVGWLVAHCRMRRGTAFDKVRVARELYQRPHVAAALAEGRISYSAARAITRATDPDPEVDAALVNLAEASTVADVELAVRKYHAYRDQDRPLDERVRDRRGIRMHPTGDGLVRIEGYLTELEAAELDAALRRYIADPHPAEGATSDMPADTAGESSAEDSGEGVDLWAAEKLADQHRQARQADALLDLVRAGEAALDNGVGPRPGAERYCTHVIVHDDGPTTLLDGTPLHPAEASRIACDTSSVEHHYNDAHEPLYLGRKTRNWTTAQQRAARVRDGGRCRFPGCGRRVADLHHCDWWEHGGATDLDNGLLLCRRHHSLVHDGAFTISGDANHTLTFHLPDGRRLGATTPDRAATSDHRLQVPKSTGTWAPVT